MSPYLRVWTVLVGVVVCFLATGPLAAPALARQDPLPLPDLVEEAGASIATILVYEQGEPLPVSQGTGWLMDEKTLVTCHHVMDGAHRAEARFPGGEVVPIIGVRAYDEARDLAVLDLPKGKTTFADGNAYLENIEAYFVFLFRSQKKTSTAKIIRVSIMF